MIHEEDRILNRYKDNYTAGLGGLPPTPSRVEGEVEVSRTSAGANLSASTPELGSERSPSEWTRHVLVARKGHQCALPQAGPLKGEGNILHQPWLGWMVHLCRVLWMKAIPRPGEPLVEVGGQSGTQEAQLLVSHSI